MMVPHRELSRIDFTRGRSQLPSDMSTRAPVPHCRNLDTFPAKGYVKLRRYTQGCQFGNVQASKGYWLNVASDIDSVLKTGPGQPTLTCKSLYGMLLS